MLNSAQMNKIALFCIVTAFVMSCPAWANNFRIDVQDFGAKGDGKTDATLSFQKALDNASEKGGVVCIAPGIYRLDGTLTIPNGVTMKGAWEGPHSSELDKGTTLLAYAGKNKESSAPFIRLATDSTLEGVTIFYPEQNVTDVHPYP